MLLIGLGICSPGEAQTPGLPNVTPPPFGYLPPKPGAPPAPKQATLPGDVSPQVKELDGVWALDGYWKENVYVNGAFKLTNGADDISKIFLKLDADGKLVLSLTKIDISKGDFLLTKAADGSYVGTFVPGTKDGNVEKIILRRIDPPRETPPPHPGLMEGKWTSIPGYLAEGHEWEFRAAKLISVSGGVMPKGSQVKVKDGVLRVFADKDGTDSFYFYPVYLPAEHLGVPPRLVELRGIRVNGNANWRMTKLVRPAGAK